MQISVRCNVRCICAVVSTSPALARCSSSTPLANVCIPAFTSSCADDTECSADDTSSKACRVSSRDGASTGIVAAASTSVDCTGIVGETLPLGPTTPDCWVAASLFGLVHMSGLDGTCCVGACATAPCHCGNTGVLTLPSLLISSSSTTFIVPCALIVPRHLQHSKMQSTM